MTQLYTNDTLNRKCHLIHWGLKHAPADLILSDAASALFSTDGERERFCDNSPRQSKSDSMAKAGFIDLPP